MADRLITAMGMTRAIADLGEKESKFCFGDVGFALSLKGQVFNVILEQGKISVL